MRVIPDLMFLVCCLGPAMTKLTISSLRFTAAKRAKGKGGICAAMASPFNQVAFMERVMGIEPTYSAWEADVLPLNYTRIGRGFYGSPRFSLPPARAASQSGRRAP